jgi:uncharacterized YccA/Bax inhibitor family protein
MAAHKKLKVTLLFALQALLLVFAALCMFYGQHNFVIRSTGILAIFAGLGLVRATRRVRFGTSLQSKPSFTVKRRQWLVGVALVLVLAASYAWLFHTAAPSYTGSLAPLWFFVAAFLACSVWWGGLFIRWFVWWFR